MKKILLLAAAAIIAAGAMTAQTPDQVRIYLNPGHGSWGPNDRPMATIPYPMLPSTGRPDTCGFYESNTNLWKVLRMGETLVKMGVDPNNIMYSRVKNGPYPYVADAPDAEIYNRNLTEISREVDANNMDMFVSVHSNAATEGTTTNYPLYLYRGQDYNQNGYEHNEGSYEMCDASWLPHYMDELDPQNYYSRTNKNIRGDWNFYGSTYQTTTVKGTFTGYLGVLRHGTPGFLVEGYFHTYQPARHRALNSDYCAQEGIRLARGVCDYFSLNPETTGYIMGTIKDRHTRIINALYTYAAGTDDQWMPLNGAEVRLLKDGVVVDTYQVDNNYNGIFVFENLEPGTYTLDASCDGYEDLFDTYKTPIQVNANQTAYAKIYLEKGGYLPPETFYKNYPDPEQPDGLEMPEAFQFTDQQAAALQMEGTVKRAIVRGDSTFVLTNVGTTEAHVYIVDNATQQVVGQVNTTGLHVETDNLGFYSPLSDIAFTSDGKLVGVNGVRNQSQDRFVDDGYKRGMLYIYKWNELNQAPGEWMSTDNSASLYRGEMGQSLVVAGSSNNCTIAITAQHNTNGNVRLLVMKYYDGGVRETYYTERSNSATHPFSKSLAGEDYRLTLSATDDTHLGSNGLIVNANNFVWDGSLINPHEITLAANSANSTDIGDIDASQADAAANGISFFRYLNRAMMVVPTIDGTSVTGLKVLDVTEGFGTAAEVTTIGATLAQAQNAEGLSVSTGAKVNGADLDLYLVVGDQFTRFTKKQQASKPGDLNGDGIVDVLDVNLCINAAVRGESNFSGNADLNGDSNIDVEDVNLLINIVLGK